MLATVRPISSQPPAWMPSWSATAPNPMANGTNVSHVAAPTPDDTLARTLDAMRSWSRRVPITPAATANVASTTWATVATMGSRTTTRVSPEMASSPTTRIRGPGRSIRKRDAIAPPSPSDAISSAHAGPYRPAPASAATSHSGPNS